MLSSFLVRTYGLLSERQKGGGGWGGSACGAIYNIRLLGYRSGVSCLY
jgi:hypothetical protein